MRGSGIFHAVFLYPAAPDTRGRACPAGHLLPQVQPMPLPAQPRGCKGRSPLHKKTKNPPFPMGRGAGGWGQQGKLKARSASEAENSFKSPPAHPRPLRALAPQVQPVPLPAQPRECKGRSPLHKKTKNSPFPPGRGSGGWGQKSKLKARSASEAENSFKSPPAHPRPLRALAPQVQPVPLPAQPRECKGRSPLHKKTKNSPFPPGRGSGGWGQKSKLKARSASEAENSFRSPPAHPCPKNAAGARQATEGRRRRTDPPSAEEKAGGREPRCTGHPEAQPRRDPPESG